VTERPERPGLLRFLGVDSRSRATISSVSARSLNGNNHRFTTDQFIEGKGIQLEAPLKMSLERAIEYIDSDEYVEATPKSLRMRKRILSATQRKRAANALA